MFSLIASFICLVIGSESAKILGVYPVPSISHQVVFRPLMLELVNRGHEVTVITTDPIYPRGDTPQNFTEINVHDVSYKMWNEFLAEKGNLDDRIKIFELVSDLITNVLEAELKTTQVQALLNNDEHFDLVFTESCVRPTLVFSHIYKAPIIEFSSLGGVFQTYESIGAATHPIIYPDPMHRRFYNLTLWEKVTELFIHYSAQIVLHQHLDYEDEMLRRIFGQSTPSLSELAKNVHMVFLNANPIWDFNRPVPPNVLYLGGMHQKPERELPADWQTYLDSSKNGVIYISFGTNVKPSLLPPEKIKILTNVFSKLPYDILWKWDLDELPGRFENIKISKWLPQSDLLKHHKVKLFITQGGLQSTDEAITAGVPLIGIPILGDQWMNVENYVKFKIGKQLSIETLTEDELVDAIQTVLEDTSYRENIVQLRGILRDQPQSALDRAVWWTEYVLRHKETAHFRAPSALISWAEYYEFKLISLLAVLTTIALILSVLTVRYVVSRAKFLIRVKVKSN